MASITLKFVPWPALSVRFDDRAIRQYLENVGEASVKAFRTGMRSSGKKSSAGQYPAIQSGRLASSVDFTVHGSDSVEVGSNTHYAGYLRFGTRKMGARKMSTYALEEGVQAARMTKGSRFARYEGW